MCCFLLAVYLWTFRFFCVISLLALIDTIFFPSKKKSTMKKEFQQKKGKKRVQLDVDVINRIRCAKLDWKTRINCEEFPLFHFYQYTDGRALTGYWKESNCCHFKLKWRHTVFRILHFFFFFMRKVFIFLFVLGDNTRRVQYLINNVNINIKDIRFGLSSHNGIFRNEKECFGLGLVCGLLYANCIEMSNNTTSRECMRHLDFCVFFLLVHSI